MNDSSASATSATTSSNSKKASQDAGTMLFITSPPFVDHVRLVTRLPCSAGKMRWTGMLAAAGGLCFERRDGGLHITPDGGTWQRRNMMPSPVPSYSARPASQRVLSTIVLSS